MRHPPLIALMLGLLASACGSDDKTTPDATTSETSEVVEDPCTPIELDDLEPLVFDGQDDVSISYSLKLKPNLAAPLPDYLVMQFINYNERIGELAMGTFSLSEGANGNFGTCPECIGLWLDQSNPSAPVGKILFQSAGSITLERDPRTRRLEGRIEGLRFAEISINQETLESAFVEGGMCARMTETIELDYKWVPPEWDCVDATYNDGGACDCDCGAIDPDCYPIDAPPAVPSADCEAAETCYLGVCAKKCSNLGTQVGCSAGEVCQPEYPDDICQPRQSKVSSVQLGQPCQGVSSYLCAPDGSNVDGACADDDARTCTKLCQGRADCEADEYCYTITGGGPNGGGKGFCHDGVPPNWLCDAGEYRDGETCHCACGFYDPDCDVAANPVDGCTGAQTCPGQWGDCQ